MNHQVPDFEIEADYSLEETPALEHVKGSGASVMDEIKELIWQDGEVVTQSQNQRSASRRTPTRLSSMSPPWKFDHEVIPSEQLHSTVRDLHQNHHHPHQTLLLPDDDMVWMHCSLPSTDFDDNSDLCDLLYATPPSTSAPTATAVVSTGTGGRSCQNVNGLNPLDAVASSGGPSVPLKMVENGENFPSFSKQRGRFPIILPSVVPSPVGSNDPRPVSTTAKESTMVDSSSTPGFYSSAFRISDAVAVARTATPGASSADYCGGTISCATTTATDTAAATNSNTTTNRETATCDITVTSSTGGSSASPQPPPVSSMSPVRETAGMDMSTHAPSNSRKRKGADDGEFPYVEDADFESANQKKKQTRCPSSSKRTRAAEVHNLSERRRRDRINEKMKALQELIPRCNKSDKASMLDEAIEYLKSLQMQVQMMSMGCGMVPMMFPGIQQYMPAMGMGLGVNVGMEMGPVLSFPNVLGGATLSAPAAAAAAAANLAPRFPVPAFHIPPVGAATDPSRMQGACVHDPMLTSFGIQNPNHVRMPNYMHPFHQYRGIPQMPLSNQGMIHSNPSRAVENHDKNQASGQ